jgi:hypothetical protein
MNRPPLVGGEAAQPLEGGTEAGLCWEAAAVIAARCAAAGCQGAAAQEAAL